LFRLLDQAAAGDSFVITKAGNPLVKVIALGPPDGFRIKRRCFKAGQIATPDDVDRMGSEEVVSLFAGSE